MVRNLRLCPVVRTTHKKETAAAVLLYYYGPNHNSVPTFWETACSSAMTFLKRQGYTVQHVSKHLHFLLVSA